jgi:hypothetical protein
MEKFAGYGFNKSHAAAYALLSYHTAYLKVHHTAAFMAANMSLAMEDTDKIKILVEDSIDVCKLTILPPDVNESQFRFTPEGPPRSVTGKQVSNIRYGLGGVKGAARARSRRSSPRARGRQVQGPVRLLQARRPQADQPPHRRIADPRRRHGLLRRRPRDAAGLGRLRDGSGRPGRGRRQPGQPVRRRRPTWWPRRNT